MYKAILFDVDGTLAEYKTGAILKNVKETIQALPKDIKLATVSNQGGVGLNYWMRLKGFGIPSDYPTEQEIRNHVGNILKELDIVDRCFTYFSFAYQSKKSGEWNPEPLASETDLQSWQHSWRKPEPGMLLRAMQDFGVSPDETLMVGDWSEDELAANAAGCNFSFAKSFFNWETSDGK